MPREVSMKLSAVPPPAPPVSARFGRSLPVMLRKDARRTGAAGAAPTSMPMPRAGVPATEEEEAAAAAAGGGDAGAAKTLLCVVREGEPGVAMATWYGRFGENGKNGKGQIFFRCRSLRHSNRNITTRPVPQTHSSINPRRLREVSGTIRLTWGLKVSSFEVVSNSEKTGQSQILPTPVRGRCGPTLLLSNFKLHTALYQTAPLPTPSSFKSHLNATGVCCGS